MDNQGDIEKYAKIADNSYGTATSKMEAYTDSVEASRQRMQNAIEKWSLQFEGQDTIKFFYDSIAYATENMHIFTATLMLLTAWLGKDTILSTLGNVFSKLGMKLTDFSLILDERLLNKKYAGSKAEERKLRRQEEKQENWRYTQQEYYRRDFDKFAKDKKLTEEEKAKLGDMQGELLGLGVNDKKEVLKGLKGSVTDQEVFGLMSNDLYGAVDGVENSLYTVMEANEAQKVASELLAETEDKMTRSILEKIQNQGLESLQENELLVANNALKDYQKNRKFFLSSMENDASKKLARVLLTRATEEEKIVLQKIADGGKESVSSEELRQANEALARIRKEQGTDELIRETEDSERFGNYQDSQRKGMLMAGGAALGGLTMSYAAGDILEGIEVLGQDLGPVGEILGGTLGSAIGAKAGEAINTGITSGFKSIGGFGWASIGITIASTIYTAWSKYNKQALKEAQEEFKEYEQKFSSMKGSDVDAKRYDELAKGVDSLGNNLTLTDEEYQEFLDKSNSLAELFPSLITRVDEAGNKFVGMGGKVGGVTSEVEKLTETTQRLTDSALFKETGFIFKNSVFSDAYKSAKKDAEDYKKIIDEISGFSIDKREKENGLNKFYYSGNRFALNEALAEEGFMIGEDYYDDNGTFFYLNELTSEEEEKLNQVLDEFLANQKVKLADAQSNFDEVTKSLQDYADATIRQDTKLNSQYKNLTDEHQQFIDSLIPSIDISSKSDEKWQEQVKNIVGSTIDEINNNEDFSAAIDFYFNPDMTISMQEFQDNRMDLLYLLATMMPGMTLDESNKLLQTFGFRWDGTVDTNGDGKLSADEIQNGLGNVVDDQNSYQKIMNEGLDTNNIVSNNLGRFSAEEMNEIYTLYKNDPGTRDFGYEQLKYTAFQNVTNDKSLTQLANMYEQYNKIQEEDLTEIDKIQKGIVEKQLNKWAGSLGVIEGDYDAILNKAKALGDLTYGGLTNMTPDQVTEKYDAYRDLYDYMKDEYNGTWDVEKLSQISADKDLAPLIGDPKAMTAKIKEFLDNGNQLYRKAIAEQVGSTEEGYDSILAGQDDLLDQFADNYMIDLTKFSTVKEAELAVDKYITGLLEGDYESWYNAMQSYYADDLEGFTDAAMKKAQINSLIIAQMKENGDYTGFEDYEWTKEYVQSGGTRLTEEGEKGYQDFVNKKLMEKQKDLILKESEDAFKDAQDRLNAILEKPFQGIKTNFDDKNGKNGKNGSDYDPMTKLEKLKKSASLIDKEYEAMVAKDRDTYTEYFKKMGDNLAEQKKAVLEEIVLLSAELEKLTPGTEEYDKKYSDLNERQADLIDIKKKIANLRDEEIEDEISRLNNREASVEALIEQQKLLLQEADTEDEIIERQKGLNDLLRQERDIRKSINDYQNELLDTQLQYNSGTAYSDSKTYDNLVNQKVENYKKNAEIALEAIEAETTLAFNNYLDLKDKFGNKLYTVQEAWYKAQNSEKVQQATKEYIEAVQAQAEVAVQVVTDKLDEISREIDMLEKQKPQEWSSIDQIKDYADSTIDYLNKKLAVIQDALKDTSGMTDDQIKDLVDQLNEVTVAIHEAQIQMHEDIKNQQEATYSALVNQVQRYIDELERAKDAVEDAYKDPIEDIEDYNKALDRTNKLLELQKNLQNASREKQRVYREGLGWVYESNREKVKQAQQELDDFYRNDKLNDLEEAKNNELALLDERIEGWNRYLEALKERYEQWQVQEEQKLLMELTNAQTEEELYQKILDDMLNYNEQADGHYDDYIGIFEDFLAEYKANLEELQRLKEQELTLMSASSYLGGNGIDIPVTSKNYNGTGMKMSGSWEEGHDYLQEALDAAKEGNMDKAYDLLTKRGYKIQSTGKNYGTTQEQALSMVLKAGNVKGYATGLDQGPVTETGPAILHGTPDNPEYVLNNDQAYNLLSNLSDTPAQELTSEDMINLNDNNIEDGNMSAEGEGADSQGSSTAGRIPGESEGSGSSMANGITTGEGDLGTICAQLATILNLLNQLNTIESTENTQNSQVISLIQSTSALLGQMYTLMQTDYQDDINMYTQILEAIQVFNTSYDETMSILFDKWDTDIPVVQELLTNINEIMAKTMELVNNILQTLGSGMGGQFSAGEIGGSWFGKFNGGVLSTSTSGSGNFTSSGNSLSGSSGGSSGGSSSKNNGKEESYAYTPGEKTNFYGSALEAAKIGDIDQVYNDLYNRGVKMGDSAYTGAGGGTTMSEAIANAESELKKAGVQDTSLLDSLKEKYSYSTGLGNGPVTYTGLAMLHGTPSEPEYILNNDQAYNLLYNMSSARMADFETKSNEDSGIQYIVQGDIILEGVEDPAKFWQEVTNAMGNRWNVTKNK